MQLEILIPTYNRCEDLLKNLALIKSIISQNSISNQVSILISNNLSTDNTDDLVINFIENNIELRIKYFKQTENIGLKKNALFVLEQAQEDYIMFLGDDDYFNTDFLLEVMNLIQSNSDIGVIIPNDVAINTKGEEINAPRESYGATLLLQKGFKSTLAHSWKGHQLSGLVLYRPGLLDAYLTNKVDNIYLFIFFVAFRSLNYKLAVVSNNPIKITQPDKPKDWGYGKDGLLGEIFDNYNKLNITYFQKFLLQKKVVEKQYWRFSMYKKHGKMQLSKTIIRLMFHKKTNLLFSLYFPLLILLQRFKTGQNA
jgi:abequosyltransferase